jgi:hypothetical protein
MFVSPFALENEGDCQTSESEADSANFCFSLRKQIVKLPVVLARLAKDCRGGA